MKLEVDLPDKLIEFIDGKVKEGLFKSREDFLVHAARFLAELYGFGGVSLIEELAKKIAGARRPTGLTPEEEFILRLFGKSTFLYPMEIYSLALQESLAKGQKPLPKERVLEIVESLIKKGYLERIKRGNEELIKVVKRLEED